MVVRESVWIKKENKRNAATTFTQRLLPFWGKMIKNSSVVFQGNFLLVLVFLRNKVSLSIALSKWKRSFALLPNTIELLRVLHYWWRCCRSAPQLCPVLENDFKAICPLSLTVLSAQSLLSINPQKSQNGILLHGER